MSENQLAITVRYLDSVASFSFQPYTESDSDETIAEESVVRYADALYDALEFAWQNCDTGTSMWPGAILMLALSHCHSDIEAPPTQEIMERCIEWRRKYERTEESEPPLDVSDTTN